MNSEKIEILITADEYVGKLKDGVLNVVDKIQEGKEMEGMSMIPAIADGIGWLLEVAEKTKDVQKKEIEYDDINEFIAEIAEAMENEDYILVSDLFNYEILPILERIHDDIKQSI